MKVTIANQNKITRRYARYAEIPSCAPGWQTFSYGKLGELTENIRTFALPFESQTYTFKMEYEYDSWNRIQTMTYPDGEVVTYGYNQGGMLKSVVGNKNGVFSDYIKEIHYNKYELKDSVTYGNGTGVRYMYDSLLRLGHLRSACADGTMQDIDYSYDSVSNITNITNSAGMLPNGLGGAYSSSYEYDNLYRLANSEGSWQGLYNLSYHTGMGYCANGRVNKKNIAARRLRNGISDTVNYLYGYFYENPVQRNTLTRVVCYGSTGDYDLHYSWTPTGNMDTCDTEGAGIRRLCWDEQNRLQGVIDENYLSYYLYDAAGDRTYKLTGKVELQNISGEWRDFFKLYNTTLYASPYVVATDKGYTKHYYAESERIASRIGGGRLQDLDQPIVENTIIDEKKEHINKQATDVLGNCLDARWYDVSTGISELYIWRDSVQPEKECYWYHPDHLGSSSWITYSDGKAVQHLHYLPWGEDFVDQRSTSWNAMYTFSAKEKDTETGYSYFGSRYYNSDLSIWLSVDPMASKYPSLSAYTYCANNPVKLVDPDGEEVWLKGDENSKAAAFKSMQEGTHLLLTMGKDGRITAEGDPISDADYLLLDAINDNSVKVNIECNRNGDAGEYHGTTYDKINSTATSTNLVNMFEMAELEKDAPVGSGIIHEVTEGYYAGLIAIATRKSIRAASRHREEITITGANIKITGDFIPDYPMDYKKYRRAHYRATPAPNEMTPAQKNNFRSPSILYRIDQLQKKLQIL